MPTCSLACVLNSISSERIVWQQAAGISEERNAEFYQPRKDRLAAGYPTCPLSLTGRWLLSNTGAGLGVFLLQVHQFVLYNHDELFSLAKIQQHKGMSLHKNDSA